MKTSNVVQAVVLMILLAIAAISCKTSRQAPRENQPPVVVNTKKPVSTEKLPPGQAKKIYGDKSAREYAPGHQKKNGNSTNYPLIIIRTPDIVISKHTDGRYYYQNSAGYYYWQGNDDRFYLDEKHLSQVDYSQDQLNDWKNKGNSNSNSNGNGNGNGNKGNNRGNGKKNA
jgi:hypothetical protein